MAPLAGESLRPFPYSLRLCVKILIGSIWQGREEKLNRAKAFSPIYGQHQHDDLVLNDFIN
jgi:hypothetical protein